jgi:hypothetical protein
VNRYILLPTRLLRATKVNLAEHSKTADCRKTFAELKAKGVEFLSEPENPSLGR